MKDLPKTTTSSKPSSVRLLFIPIPTNRGVLVIRREDESGTPYCILVDDNTLNCGVVGFRHRNNGLAVRTSVWHSHDIHMTSVWHPLDFHDIHMTSTWQQAYMDWLYLFLRPQQEYIHKDDLLHSLFPRLRRYRVFKPSWINTHNVNMYVCTYWLCKILLNILCPQYIPAGLV